MRFLFFSAVILQVSSSAFGIADKIGCRDENRNLIDWFYIYKLPKAVQGTKKSETGLTYLFVIPSANPEWVLSDKLINESTSMPGITLEEVYKKDKDNKIKLLYNDEPPNSKADENRGHTKGVVVANNVNGFWLLHSVPHYPSAIDEGQYKYPKSGEMYGQSFLCISLTGDQIGKVGKQLQFNEPQFYSSNVPHSLVWIYPELVEALKMEPIISAPFFNIETIKSRFKTDFVSFAKSRKFQKELYEDLAAPYFNEGEYFVESWRHGPGNIKSDCSKPSKVFNIEQIRSKALNISFETLQDHSKWMSSEEKKLICVGDINRQEHQKFRGGGTVCQKSKLASVYNDLIMRFEKCTNSSSS